MENYEPTELDEDKIYQPGISGRALEQLIAAPDSTLSIRARFAIAYTHLKDNGGSPNSDNENAFLILAAGLFGDALTVLEVIAPDALDSRMDSAYARQELADRLAAARPKLQAHSNPKTATPGSE